MQRRVQCALFHRQRLGGRRVNPLDDLVSVLLAGGEGAENQELQRALQQIGRLVWIYSHKPLRAQCPLKHLWESTEKISRAWTDSAGRASFVGRCRPTLSFEFPFGLQPLQFHFRVIRERDRGGDGRVAGAIGDETVHLLADTAVGGVALRLMSM